MTIKKYVPIIIIVLLSIVAWSLGIQHYFTFDALKKYHQLLEGYIAAHTIFAVLIYAGIYITVVGLSIPGAAFMTLAGGIFFGQWVGTVTAVISASLGATVLFFSAKMASQDLMTQKAGTWVQKMQKGFQNGAFFYLLTLRLIPIFPFFAVNLAAALLQVPLLTFFFGTVLGIIPGSFVYVSLGVALQKVIYTQNVSPKLILDPKILLALGGLGLLSLLPIAYKWIRGKSG